MKAPIFFDQVTSYHPLPGIVDILKKPLHPHTFSSMQSKEDVFKKNAYVESIRAHLGLGKESTLCLSPGGSSAVDQMLYHFYLQEMFHSGKQHIVTTHTDRSLLGDNIEELKTLGVMCDYVQLDSKGHITEEKLRSVITPRTSLLSFSWANPLTGIIQPVGDIAQFCHKQGVACHIDASHVIGKLYFNLADLPVDYVTFDAKPFHGPHPVGGWIAQSKTAVKAEELTLQLEALDLALAHAHNHIDDMHLEIARLRLSFEKQIMEKIPHAEVLCQEIERLPHISVISFPHVHHEYFLYLLRQEHLYASIGGGNEMLLETLLRSMGIAPLTARCALSFSLSYKTTQEEIDIAVERICKRYTQAQTLVQKVYS